MRRRQKAIQGDLFGSGNPARVLTADQRKRLIPLLAALLAEVRASDRLPVERREGGHDQDHA